ncbi:hypothetical protein EW146_g5228 [Bondarzewia mesenterica]|uniref:RING-type domain-containing protein n=1 Tax=Bondarzewia mesenterica TaxID=1095465 RepID=A0A4S4LS32_9AGAM|nr:hypothetical protein EW146_g5228 [Bondarzewia mesenterica]
MQYRGRSDGRLTSQQIRELVTVLPKLSEDDLESLGHRESSCPICMNTFLAALAEEELAFAMDSPANPTEDAGVTRLSRTCGHLFCRKELSASPSSSHGFPAVTPGILTWIRDGVSSLFQNPSTRPPDSITYPYINSIRPVHSAARPSSSLQMAPRRAPQARSSVTTTRRMLTVTRMTRPWIASSPPTAKSGAACALTRLLPAADPSGRGPGRQPHCCR